ncbi:MAG: hypothetical protein Q9M92_07330 [Enterobacterales bacterium]|nr:hypothetical protein [Enterobacterales bacterium]
MTNPLVSTGIKTAYWYIVLLGIFIASVFYWFSFGNPSRKDELYTQAFYLNSKAFENAIYFARVKFMSDHTQISSLDRWTINGIGLDYNNAGYPTGTDVDDSYYDRPQTVENCQQIWRFILGPLQPKLLLQPTENNYWVELNDNNICIYRPFHYKNLEIRYDSALGKVETIKISQNK